jgi:hypothetical protein
MKHRHRKYDKLWCGLCMLSYVLNVELCVMDGGISINSEASSVLVY